MITLVHGNDRTLELTVTESDGSTPAHINGASLRFTLKASTLNPDARALIVKTTGDGSIVVLDTGAEDANKGKARIEIGRADWASVTMRKPRELWPWDVQQYLNGDVSTVLGTPVGDDPMEVVLSVSRSAP